MDNMGNISAQLGEQIANDFWPGYVHSYPHKKAYRPLSNLSMEAVWRDVNETNLYIHIPFCDRKCAFCNLFSTPLAKGHSDSYLDKYIDTLCNQIDYNKNYIGEPKIRSLFYGGGTPNVLSIKQLERIQEKIHKKFSDWANDVEECIECSPDRLDRAYISDLTSIGFSRVSLGVQTFFQHELDLVNRKYDSLQVYKVYEFLKEYGLNVNIDLIYGLPKQTELTIRKNLEIVTQLNPETITIYPLAVRKLTGIESFHQKDMLSMKEKYQQYDIIRDSLEDGGYYCQTVVRFVKGKGNTSTYQQQRLEFNGIPTLGLGAGARSYSPAIHYCLPYKIQTQYVRPIIDSYIDCDFSSVLYDGFVFDSTELKRKFVILSLLDPGLDMKQYEANFNEPLEKLFEEEMKALIDNELISSDDSTFFTLTRKGRKYCDLAVHVFESEKVKNLYTAYKAQ